MSNSLLYWSREEEEDSEMSINININQNQKIKKLKIWIKNPTRFYFNLIYINNI